MVCWLRWYACSVPKPQTIRLPVAISGIQSSHDKCSGFSKQALETVGHSTAGCSRIPDRRALRQFPGMKHHE